MTARKKDDETVAASAPRQNLLEELSDIDAAVLAQRAESLAQEEVDELPEDVASVMLFGLGDEWYAVRVEQVREIFSGFTVTRVPCTSDHILGVINIRGDIISVTDIRKLLHLPDGMVDLETAVIVVHDERSATALTVDEIGEIIEVAQDDIQPPLSVLEKSQAEYISGSIYADGRLVALVNLDKVLAPVGGAE